MCYDSGMEKDTLINSRHIDILDGVRALSVIFVMIFHFWQQTWIFPVVKTPFLSFIGIDKLDFTPIARVGYLFVDMMILISGFLLFLPAARNIVSGDPIEGWGRYFKKRAIRILPSYLFCIIVLFVYEVIGGGFGDPVEWRAALCDLFLHLTFMHTWTVNSYLGSKLSTVLWTLGVEVWFYILFPVIASFIKRRQKENSTFFPIIRAGIIAAFMIILSLVYIYAYVLNSGSEFASFVDSFLLNIRIGDPAKPFISVGIRSTYPAMVINQLPAFLGVYAVGMLGSIAYAFISKYMKRRWWSGLISIVVSVLFIVVIWKMLKECASLDPELAQIWQVTRRLGLALIFMGFILSTALASKPYRLFFSNKLMVFLSTISYNLYIWHQWLCVKIKYDWRIPFWAGDKPPNQLNTPEAKIWSWKYALIITAAAIIAAVLATYLIERPAADLLNGRKSIYNGKLKEGRKKTAG